MCDVTKAMVSQWESDKITPATDRLMMLRKHLDFSCDWLLFGKEEPAVTYSQPVQELLKVAENLPSYAVVKLTREGNSYAELIEQSKSGEASSG